MFKKFLFWVLIIILIVLLPITLRLLTNPRSIADDGNEIRSELLIETPIGTHEDEVRLFIKEHEHWEDLGEFTAGISQIDARYIYGNTSNDSETRNIEVRMEKQRAGLTSTEISYAIWRFDEKGKLVDILTQVSVYPLYGWY